jgi:hypothetical protein
MGSLSCWDPCGQPILGAVLTERSQATAETMRSYLNALLARGNFADYFVDEVTWTTVGTGQQLQGRQPVRDFITRPAGLHPHGPVHPTTRLTGSLAHPGRAVSRSLLSCCRVALADLSNGRRPRGDEVTFAGG